MLKKCIICSGLTIIRTEVSSDWPPLFFCLKFEKCVKSSPLVYADVVDFHFNGEVVVIHGAYPLAAELHVEEEVHGKAEWPLLLVGKGGLTGVGVGVAMVDVETDAVGIDVHTVDVEVVGVDGACAAVLLAGVDMEGVVGVDGLVGYAVAVETLHDVYFAAAGPSVVSFVEG